MRRALSLVLLLWLGNPACGQTQEQPSAGATRGAGRSTVSFHEVGAGPRAVAVADLDGDGHPDVVVANAGDGTVTVLFGDGTGQLGRSASIAAGPEPSDVDVVDLDRDGDIDLIVANHETPNITVLLNDAHGRFAPAPASPFNTGARPHVHGLATGDFNGDGWPDVAVESADTKEARVLRGGPRGFSMAVGVPVGTMPYFRLGVAQVTGDGSPDILVPGHGDNTLRVIEGEGGQFHLAPWKLPLASQPWMVVSGDVNGDRRDDIVVVETDAVSVWHAGDRGFAQTSSSRVPTRGVTEVATGDLDGDGAADIAIGPWDGDEVTVLIGRAAPRRIRMCERPIGLAIADLNGDGRGELLATCVKANTLAVTTVVPR